jgi:hypothetical protein
MKKDILTDEIIKADMKSSLARNGTTPIDVVIVGVACYAFAVLLLFLARTEPRMYLVGGIAFILSTILTVSTIRKSVIYSKQKKRLDACDISVGETRLSSVYDDVRRVGGRFGRYEAIFHFCFAAGEWCLTNTMLYKWSKEYHLSVDGLENISLEGDEFYAVIDNETQTVVYAYPKKFFEYEKN